MAYPASILLFVLSGFLLASVFVNANKVFAIVERFTDAGTLDGKRASQNAARHIHNREWNKRERGGAVDR